MTVHGCYDCPFHSAQYDSYSMYKNTADYCGLTEKLIAVRDLEEPCPDTPKWCPLREGFVTVELKE